MKVIAPNCKTSLIQNLKQNINKPIFKISKFSFMPLSLICKLQSGALTVT